MRLAAHELSICAENVSSIVEYVSGIQTFRAYDVDGLKNKTVINAMDEPEETGSMILDSTFMPVIICTIRDSR